jgi:hypothetical protein
MQLRVYKKYDSEKTVYDVYLLPEFFTRWYPFSRYCTIGEAVARIPRWSRHISAEINRLIIGEIPYAILDANLFSAE